MHDTIRLPDARHVIGVQVRTKNADEIDPASGRIGPLWGRFLQENLSAQIPNRTPDSPVMAVYSNYESDQHGEYSLTVGCEVTTLEKIPDGMAGVTIAAAMYAVFPVPGSDPSTAVPEAWRRVWAEFRDAAAGSRAYTTDFEEYQFGPDGAPVITLYIAVV